MFGGEVAALYAQVFENNRPCWEAIADAVDAHSASPPTTVLDLAAGPGEPTTLMAQRLGPDCHVTCTDVAPDMVAKAAQRTATAGVGERVRCIELDVTDMGDAVPAASFDAVVMSYGLMFLPDLDKGLREVHRVVKPGGLFVTTVWVDFWIMKVCRVAMAAALQAEPPTPQINPLSLSAPGALEDPLRAAGFELVDVAEHEYSFNFGSDPELAIKCSTLPVQGPIAELDDPEAAERARKATEEYLAGSWNADGDCVSPPCRFKLAVVRRVA